ncbi:amidohydrolase family protein [Flexivirga meconopsidis]|uniref:amidohydrolase family protein n=1 Tax=Flexivirga meconopsidis TaxID=2977121 RepID=UPI00223F4B36|nr:amidohydrolase family protein [Flexivirga meconopsidis]
MSQGNRIDVHHHVIPPDYAKLLHDKGIQPGGIPLPEWSAQQSLRLMDANGIATAILSVSTPGVWFGDAGEARRWARRVNEYAAGVVAERPDRFGMFATLTLPDVDGAIAEANFALDELHADGIVLLANNGGSYLGDPAFERLLGLLDERGAVVFVHPGELPGDPVEGIPSFTADFLLDTTRTAISLILSGAMERYRRVRWILAHAGGFVPYVAHRILLTTLRTEPKWKLAALALDRNRAVAHRMEMFQRFWFDVALSSTPATYPSLLAVADRAKVLYGSDFPFAPKLAVKYMRQEHERADLTPQTRSAIDRSNAERLFPRLAQPIPTNGDDR